MGLFIFYLASLFYGGDAAAITATAARSTFPLEYGARTVYDWVDAQCAMLALHAESLPGRDGGWDCHQLRDGMVGGTVTS